MKPTAEDIEEFVKLYPALPVHLLESVVRAKFPAVKTQSLTVILTNLARAGRIVRIVHSHVKSTVENSLYVPKEHTITVESGGKSRCPYDGGSFL